MKLFEISVTGLKEVIDLKAENDELKRGIGELMLYVARINKPENRQSLKNKYDHLSYVINRVCDLIEENDKLRKQSDESAHLSPFEHYKYHTLCARATLYPGKTIEEVTAIVDSRKEAFES